MHVSSQSGSCSANVSRACWTRLHRPMADGDDADRKTERQCILRFPPEVAAKVREKISSGNVDGSLKFEATSENDFKVLQSGSAAY